jgi:hypothetical protein
MTLFVYKRSRSLGLASIAVLCATCGGQIPHAAYPIEATPPSKHQKYGWGFDPAPAGSKEQTPKYSGSGQLFCADVERGMRMDSTHKSRWGWAFATAGTAAVGTSTVMAVTNKKVDTGEAVAVAALPLAAAYLFYVATEFFNMSSSASSGAKIASTSAGLEPPSSSVAAGACNEVLSAWHEDRAASADATIKAMDERIKALTKAGAGGASGAGGIGGAGGAGGAGGIGGAGGLGGIGGAGGLGGAAGAGGASGTNG